MSDFIIAIKVLFLVIAGTALICAVMGLILNICDRILIEIEARKYVKKIEKRVKERRKNE